MIKIIIKNELRNGKREPPKERGWCVCVCVCGGGGGGWWKGGEKLHAKEN